MFSLSPKIGQLRTVIVAATAAAAIAIAAVSSARAHAASAGPGPAGLPSVMILQELGWHVFQLPQTMLEVAPNGQLRLCAATAPARLTVFWSTDRTERNGSSLRREGPSSHCQVYTAPAKEGYDKVWAVVHRADGIGQVYLWIEVTETAVAGERAPQKGSSLSGTEEFSL